MGSGVLLKQAGAEAGFNCEGGGCLGFALFLAGGDGGVPADLPLFDAVVAHTKEGRHYQGDG